MANYIQRLPREIRALLDKYRYGPVKIEVSRFNTPDKWLLRFYIDIPCAKESIMAVATTLKELVRLLDRKYGVIGNRGETISKGSCGEVSIIGPSLAIVFNAATSKLILEKFNTIRCDWPLGWEEPTWY